MTSKGRPRIHPPTFTYRARSAVRRGTLLPLADKQWIRAVYAVRPDLTRTWWRCRDDGHLDRRYKWWLTTQQAKDYRYFVEDDVSRELNR